MKREELIEEAAAAIFDAADLQLAPDDQMWELARRDARAVLAVFEKAQAPTTNYIDIVFDGPPEAEAGRFVEVEDATGASVKFGEWVERPDGYWALRIPAPQTPANDEREALELLIAKLREAKYPEGLDAWATGDIAHAILAAGFRRPAQTEPTDEEREALTQAALDSERLRQIAEWLSMEHGHEETAKRVNLIADRHEADTLRRPAQTEPTEAQIEVIADSIESFFEEHVHVARRLYPDVWKRDLALVVLKAAFTAGQEEQS